MPDGQMVYLSKPEADTFEKVISPSDGWEQRQIEHADWIEAQFWVKPNALNEPRFKAQYEEFADLSDIEKNRRSSSTLLLKVDGRVFVECTGSGHSMVRKYMCEADFGLILVSRFGSNASIRALRVRNGGPIPTSTTVRTAKDTNLSGMLPLPLFGELVLLGSMPNEERRATGLNSRLEGTSGFKETSPFTGCDERVELFRHYLSVYMQGSALPASFKLTQPSDIPSASELSQQLYDDLFARMYEGGSPDIEIMLPDDVDADVVGSDITVHDQQRIHVITELNWQAIAAVLGEHEELSVARLRKARLIVHSDGAEPESESLLSCILCEVERGSDRYLHENGRWKRYSRNLIQMLDLTLDENEIDSYPNPLPSWDPEWDEDEYNQATAKDFNMLCLDKVLWKESRHGSGIEICDLLTESGDIIHVKKFRNTQSMSHFAHQVETSARALAQHGGAKEWLGRKRQENNWNALPTIHGRQVILAIGSNRDGKLSQSLPTGSKFALSRAIISLNAFGFKPILQRIPIERTVNVTAIQQLAVPVRSGMTQTTGH